MNLMENYSLLFTDTLFANFVFSFTDEIAIKAMLVFDTYPKYLIALTALGAYIIACLINYYMGKICYNILAPMNKNEQELMNQRLVLMRGSRIFKFIFLFSAAPFYGKFLILFAGFCKVNLKQTLLITIISKIIFLSILFIL